MIFPYNTACGMEYSSILIDMNKNPNPNQNAFTILEFPNFTVLGQQIIFLTFFEA